MSKIIMHPSVGIKNKEKLVEDLFVESNEMLAQQAYEKMIIAQRGIQFEQKELINLINDAKQCCSRIAEEQQTLENAVNAYASAMQKLRGDN